MNIKLSLTIEETNIILSALVKLPIDVGVNVWLKVKNEAQLMNQPLPYDIVALTTQRNAIRQEIASLEALL